MDDLSPASNLSEDNEDHDIADFYSKTPPRTQIIRRNRSRKEKEKM